MQPRMPYNYDDRAGRWRDPATGRFISESNVVSEMERHQDATFNTLENLTRQLYNNDITLEQWQISTASELKDAHLAQSMFANGGKNNMTPANYGRVGGVLRSEYRFLQNFANDIANGKVSEAQALARIRQYGRATKQSYWREYKEKSGGLVQWNLNPAEHCGDCLNLASGGDFGNGIYEPDRLSTVPGAGDTACRGNCKCTLTRIER